MWFQCLPGSCLCVIPQLSPPVPLTKTARAAKQWQKFHEFLSRVWNEAHAKQWVHCFYRNPKQSHAHGPVILKDVNGRRTSEDFKNLRWFFGCSSHVLVREKHCINTWTEVLCLSAARWNYRWIKQLAGAWCNFLTVRCAGQVREHATEPRRSSRIVVLITHMLNCTWHKLHAYAISCDLMADCNCRLQLFS